jgi:hypothetical protein
MIVRPPRNQDGAADVVPGDTADIVVEECRWVAQLDGAGQIRADSEGLDIDVSLDL